MKICSFQVIYLLCLTGGGAGRVWTGGGSGNDWEQWEQRGQLGRRRGARAAGPLSATSPTTSPSEMGHRCMGSQGSSALWANCCYLGHSSELSFCISPLLPCWWLELGLGGQLHVSMPSPWLSLKDWIYSGVSQATCPFHPFTLWRAMTWGTAIWSCFVHPPSLPGLLHEKIMFQGSGWLADQVQHSHN